MALAGKGCLVKGSGASAALTTEPMVEIAGGPDGIYQITNEAKQVLDPYAAITVFDAGVAVAPANYVLDRLFGKVTFLVLPGDTDAITMTGRYLPMATIVEAHAFQITGKATNADSTRFNDDFVRRQQVHQDITGTLSQHALSADTLWDNVFLNDLQLLLEFWFSSATETEPDMRVWCLPSQNQRSGSVTALVEQSITWEGSYDADKRVVSFG